jgi:putative oxidoreductase
MNLDWLGRRLLGVALGGLFFYAGLQKAFHPYEFVEAVLAYQLVPVRLVGAMAAALIWVELAAGGGLILGLKRCSCLIILIGLIVGFLVVIFITMARGLEIDCGCGLFLPREVGWGAAAGDLVFLLWAGALWYWERLRSRPAPGSLSLSS